jgi:N-acetylglucosamine-6-phosphate deacetylase
MRGIDPSASLGVDGEHGRTIDRREPGASGAALLDKRVTAEVIADLVHVDKALLRLLFKTKDRDKVILITDSIDAEAAHNKCSKSRGAYRFKDGTLAGSVLHMIEAVRNAVTAGGLSIAEAVRLATENPARILGLERRKGVIAKGMDADIVLFDRNFNVKATIIMGNLVFSGPSFANIRMTKYKQRTTRLDITEGKCAG